MNFSLVTGDITQLPGQVLLLPVFEEDLRSQRAAALSAVDRKLQGLLVRAAGQESFSGKADQTFTFHTHGKLRADRVVLVGLGSKARFGTEALRQAAGRGVRVALKCHAASIVVGLPEVARAEEAVRAVAEGLVLGAYRFDRYRTRARDDRASNVSSVRLWAQRRPTRDLQNAIALGSAVGDAVNWARDLVNEPAGVMTPKRLAAEARQMAKDAGLRITVKGRRDIARLRMGMFLGVAQGSSQEPLLVQVSYVPRGAAAAQRPPLVLVGKAITFDSGGLSLKTADGMVDMKTDMAGSAAVLGAMRVVAELKPPFPVHALLGACENMPSGTAYRPGDVLISRLGKTVEITNTDAEGRLVLGDVLAYANEMKPAAIVDLATLTGACMVALGHYIAGAFTADDGIADEVLAAGRRAGEELWRLPLSELQKDQLRSEIADLKNAGERWGSAISAALFLKEFVGDTPWLHLDIAGPSQSPKERGYFVKGATGAGVRTLVEWMRQRQAAASSGRV